MNTKTVITLFVFILILLTICSPVFAVPTLQLYMPDATYNSTTESWLTTSNPFYLWTLGATSPAGVTYIDDVELHIALLESEFPGNIGSQDPLFTISDFDPTANTDLDPNISFSKTLYKGDFQLGLPPELSRHGIYPTYYSSVDLPNLMALAAGETVYNYNPGETGSDSGDIQKYWISYDSRFSFVHFDLSGIAHDDKRSFLRVAPYSHDADKITVIPEPASLSLLGLGVLSLVARLRKKFSS